MGDLSLCISKGVTTADRNFTHFNAWQLTAPEPDDVAVISDLLDSLEAELCIDTDRVYSTGMSNGAMIAVRLACSLSNRTAAIGTVAGTYCPPMDNGLNGSETCPDTRPVPIIAFHGTSDTFVPFAGGPGGIPNLFPANFRLPIDNSTSDEDVMEDWAAHNGCASGRQESQVDTEVRLVQYDSCNEGANLELCIVDGGGHTWPDAVDRPSLGYTTHQISATDLIWKFFQGHSLNTADSDGDGCPNISELQTAPGSETFGGLRNPQNPYDYFNPSHDGQNRVDDILLVVHQYFIDSGNPNHTQATDRTLLGPNAWNLGAPDGQQHVDDILNIVHEYSHDCS